MKLDMQQTLEELGVDGR